MRRRALLIVAALLTIRPLATYALQIDLQILTQPHGQLFEAVILTCLSQDTSYCQQLCNDPAHCTLPQPFCRNCYGSASRVLYDLFNHAHWNFSVLPTAASPSVLVKSLQDGRHLLIGINSLFNFYKPIHSPELSSEWRNLCPVAKTDPYWLVEVDDDHEACAVKWLVCRNMNEEDTTYNVIPRTSLPLRQNMALKSAENEQQP